MPDIKQKKVPTMEDQLRNLIRIADKLGLQIPEVSSNPGAPTVKNRVSDSRSTVFGLIKSSVPDKKTRKFTKKPLKSRSGYPYREAYLTPADHDITKTWYINFYAWDIGKEQLIRRRVLKDDLAEIKDLQQRINYANKAIARINEMLKGDYYLEGKKNEPQIIEFDFRGYSLIDAINYVINYKREVENVKKGTLEEYVSMRTTLGDFFVFNHFNSIHPEETAKRLFDDYMTVRKLEEKEKLFPKIKNKMLLREVTKSLFDRYFEYLKVERKLANKTVNNRATMLHAVFKTLIGLDSKLFRGKNPVAYFEHLKTETRKHAAYTDVQILQLKEAILQGKEPHLITFIQFMLYTLARPNELRLLKVGHIRLEERRILFVAENAKTSIEQYVGINDMLYDIIKQARITEFPPHYYVFSNHEGKHTPGPDPVSENYFYKRIKRYINSLGFYKINKNYDLYSFCHTGAIGLYLATRDIKLVQAQKRHQTLEQTNTYLRDLGLFSNFEQLNKYKGPV